MESATFVVLFVSPSCTSQVIALTEPQSQGTETYLIRRQPNVDLRQYVVGTVTNDLEFCSVTCAVSDPSTNGLATLDYY